MKVGMSAKCDERFVLVTESCAFGLKKSSFKGMCQNRLGADDEREQMCKAICGTWKF